MQRLTDPLTEPPVGEAAGGQPAVINLPPLGGRPRPGADATPEVVAETIATSGQRAGGLVRSGLIVAGAVVAANALNAAFQFVMARLLEPAEFSLLATMFAVMIMIMVPVSGLQAATARQIARDLKAAGLGAAGALLRDALRQTVRWMLLVMALFALSAWPLIELFNIDRPLPFVATALAVAVALPLPIAFGALQGTERFGALSMVQPVYAALKLIAGVTVALLGFGASAVTFGVAGATVISIAVALVPLRRLLRAADGCERRARTADEPRLAGYSVGAAIGFCAYAVHTSSDIIVARLSFDAVTAGEWAAAAVAAKTILLIPVAVNTVLFPRVAVLGDRARERGHMLAGLGAVAGVGLLVAAFMAIFAEPLVDLAFGSRYAAAADWLGLLAFPMVLYAVVQVYVFHFLALGLIRYSIVTAVFLGVQLALFAVLHSQPTDLILVQAIAAGLLVAAGEVVQLGVRRRSA